MDSPAMQGPGVPPLCCETMLPLSTTIANYRCKNLLTPTGHASKCFGISYNTTTVVNYNLYLHKLFN